MIDYLEKKYNKSFKTAEGKTRWGKIIFIILAFCVLKFIYDAFFSGLFGERK